MERFLITITCHLLSSPSSFAGGTRSPHPTAPHQCRPGLKELVHDVGFRGLGNLGKDVSLDAIRCQSGLQKESTTESVLHHQKIRLLRQGLVSRRFRSYQFSEHAIVVQHVYQRRQESIRESNFAHVKFTEGSVHRDAFQHVLYDGGE